MGPIHANQKQIYEFQNPEGKFQETTKNTQLKQSNFSYIAFKNVQVFLTLPDVHNLSLTCKKLKAYQMQNSITYAIHLYKNYLSRQIQFPLDIWFMDYPSIGQEMQQEKFNKLINSNNHSYNSQLELLKNFTKISNEINFLNTYPFLSYLCESQCPIPILKRETIGVYCVSEYQNMLALRISTEQNGRKGYLEGQGKYFQLTKYLSENQILLVMQTIQELSKCDKEQFLNLRWSLVQEDTSCKIQTTKPMLIHIFQLLVDSINLYTQTISVLLAEHLHDITNAYDLLLDYCLYWQAYSRSMLHMDQQLNQLQTIFNDLYLQLFPNYPQFPKLSYWRIMTQKWLQNIYGNIQVNKSLAQVLEQSFLKIVKSRRNQLMSIQFKDVKPQKDEILVPTLDYITKELYSNFVNRKKISTQYNPYEIDVAHQFFTQTPNESDNLLRQFFQIIQDISLNEVNVHWLGHTKCQFESPFKSLQKCFLQETSYFYEQQRSVFQNNFSQYMEFLEWDLKYKIDISRYVSMITYEPLVHQLFELQKEHLFTLVKNYFSEKVIHPFLRDETKIVSKVYQAHFIENQGESLSKTDGDIKNELLETNEDEPEQLLNFFMENPYADIQEKILHKKLKEESNPFLSVIRVAVQGLKSLVKSALFEHDVKLPWLNSSQQMQLDDETENDLQLKQNCLMRTVSQIIKEDELLEVPEQLVKILNLKILDCDAYSQIIENFQNFCVEYQKNRIKFQERNNDIEMNNDSRGIPKELSPSAQEFYNITNQLTLQKVLTNIQVQENIPQIKVTMQHSGSKEEQLKAFNQEKIILENEEDIEDYDFPPTLSLKK